jgi:hypothetical protein
VRGRVRFIYFNIDRRLIHRQAGTVGYTSTRSSGVISLYLT